MPYDVRDLSCVLSGMLPKWISSKVFTTNLVTCAESHQEAARA